MRTQPAALWDNFDSTLTQLWENFETILKSLSPADTTYGTCQSTEEGDCCEPKISCIEVDKKHGALKAGYKKSDNLNVINVA